MLRETLAIPANSNGVHDPCHAGGLEGNRLRELEFQISIDKASKIHHVIQSMDVE